VPPGPLSGDTTAASQVVAFTVAGLVFVAAVGAVLVVVRDAGTSDLGAAAANQESRAERLADLLVGSPGIGLEDGSDSIQRLGLLAENGSGLQQSTIDAMRGAAFVSKADDKLDYQEALASLDLEGDERFHIRIYPVAVPSLYRDSLADVRTAFIGDWVSLATVTVPLDTDVKMVAETRLKIDTTMFALTGNERKALATMGMDYDDKVYISSLAPTILVDMPFPLPDMPLTSKLASKANVELLAGDVYPDVKGYLDANLGQRLPLYDVLIVGSGVDQSAMTSNAVKNAIRDWVLDGGTLVVLGSDKANYQWLQPLFGVGVKTVNGSPVATDVSHPLLKDPYALNWPDYNDHGMGWELRGDSHDLFNHVVVKGGTDVLAISRDGAFGGGRIMLTTYMAREIAQTLGPTEAQRFFENVILYADRAGLYLDYGPSVPADTPVSVAVRQSFLWDGKLGQVPVRIEIHAWAG
jgi:hypothetical protein